MYVQISLGVKISQTDDKPAKETKKSAEKPKKKKQVKMAEDKVPADPFADYEDVVGMLP